MTNQLQIFHINPFSHKYEPNQSGIKQYGHIIISLSILTTYKIRIQSYLTC